MGLVLGRWYFWWVFILGGGVIIEKDVMVGVRSTIRQGIKIGRDSIIGMCSVIIKNIKANSLTLPTPTKIYR